MIILTFLLSSFSLKAEYRVYQYSVQTTLPKEFDQHAYLVTSTLNPVSYLAYHGGATSLQLDLLRTWMCPGDTSNGKDICTSPEQQFLQMQKVIK